MCLAVCFPFLTRLRVSACLLLVDVDSQLLCWEEVSLTGLRDRGPLDITLVDHNALRQDLIDELEGVRKGLEYRSLRPSGGEATSEAV